MGLYHHHISLAGKVNHLNYTCTCECCWQPLAQQNLSSKQKEIQKLSDHTRLKNDLAKPHYAGKRVQMKPALVEHVLGLHLLVFGSI